MSKNSWLALAGGVLVVAVVAAFDLPPQSATRIVRGPRV